MSLFFGPSRSPLTDALDAAFSDKASSEDLALHLEICDIIGETEKGHKDAVWVIKKRLGSKPPPPTAIKILAVLETCVKNCGRRFHLLIAQQDFLTVLARFINPPASVQMASIVREKALHLLQTWADAFRGQPGLENVPKLYDSMVAKGVEFPAQDLSALSPIFTPKATVDPAPRDPAANGGTASAAQGSTFRSQVQADEEYARELAHQLEAEERAAAEAAAAAASPRTSAQPQQAQPQRPVEVPEVVQELAPNQRVVPTDRQTTKLQRDLKAVNETAELLAETLDSVSHGPPELEFFVQLTGTCQTMQERVIELLGHVDSEVLLGELLATNDRLAVLLQQCQSLAKQYPEVAAAFAQTPAPQGIRVGLPADASAHPPSETAPEPGHSDPAMAAAAGGAATATATAALASHSAEPSLAVEEPPFSPLSPVASQESGPPSYQPQLPFSDPQLVPSYAPAPAYAPPDPIHTLADSPSRAPGPGPTAAPAAAPPPQQPVMPLHEAEATDPPAPEPEFDMFAQSRKAFDERRRVELAATDYTPEDFYQAGGKSGLAGAMFASANPGLAATLEPEPEPEPSLLDMGGPRAGPPVTVPLQPAPAPAPAPVMPFSAPMIPTPSQPVTTATNNGSGGVGNLLDGFDPFAMPASANTASAAPLIPAAAPAAAAPAPAPAAVPLTPMSEPAARGLEEQRRQPAGLAPGVKASRQNQMDVAQEDMFGL